MQSVSLTPNRTRHLINICPALVFETFLPLCLEISESLRNFAVVEIKVCMMKKILFIVGSLREGSFNRQLAREAEQMIGARAEVTYLDYTDVPLMNQDIEFPEPEAVRRLRASVKEADGIWVFTPEYNFSYDYETPTVINGKKVALSGTGGKMATAKCREKLTELLTFAKANVMEQQTGVVLNLEAWTEGRMILSDEQKKALKDQVEAFLKFV